MKKRKDIVKRKFFVPSSKFVASFIHPLLKNDTGNFWETADVL